MHVFNNADTPGKRVLANPNLKSHLKAKKKDIARSATTSSGRSESIDFDQYNGCLIEINKPIIPRHAENSAAADFADVLKKLGNKPTAFSEIPEVGIFTIQVIYTVYRIIQK